MPFSNLVLTAGISALGPRNEIGARLREKGSPLVFPDKKQNPEAADPELDADSLALSCLEFLAVRRARDPRAPDPQTVSAEYSMLHAVRAAGKLTPGACVHLIHTPTPGGRLAVELQKDLLENDLNVQVHARELPIPFDPALPGGLALASGAFIGVVSRLLAGHDPHTTAFAPIGGYKVMVALGHTAASFHGFPSLYLHEDSQILQEIAPAPVAIAPETRSLIAPLARRVGNGEDWNALSTEDRDLISRHPAFFARIDGLVELNELGQFIRLAAIPIRPHPDAAAILQVHRTLLTGQLDQILQQAVADPDHPGINHHFVTTTGRAHPWRLAKMGRGVRIAWQITPDALLIRKIWTDHDSYEREARSVIEGAAADSSSWQAFGP